MGGGAVWYVNCDPGADDDGGDNVNLTMTFALIIDFALNYEH